MYIKIFTIISLFFIFNGCNSSSNKNTNKEDIQQSKKTTIKGASTLAKATVCIDENSDNFCNESEPQTLSDEKGNYSLLYDGEVAEATTILAQGGDNLNLLEENKAKLMLKASFLNGKEGTNLNTFTTFIATRVNKGLTHQKAKEAVANKYGVDVNHIEKNPLDFLEDKKNKNIFLTLRAIEDNIIHSKKKKFSASSLKLDANENLIITEEEADEALFNFDIFDFDLLTFRNNLANVFILGITSIGNFLECTILGDCPLSDINMTKPTPEANDTLSEDFVSKYEMSGVWYDKVHNYCFKTNFITNIWTLHPYAYQVSSFSEENRLVVLRGIEVTGYILPTGYNDIYRAYSLYKSQNSDDKIYMSSPDLEEKYILSRFNSLKSCKSNIVKMAEEHRLNAGGDLSINAINTDSNKDKNVTRESLNGVWYQRFYFAGSEYTDIGSEYGQCLEITDDDFLKNQNNFLDDKELIRFNYLDSKMHFLELTRTLENNKSITISSKNVDIEIYESKKSSDTLYFIQNGDKYSKLVRDTTIKHCYSQEDIVNRNKDGLDFFFFIKTSGWEGREYKNYTFTLKKTYLSDKEEENINVVVKDNAVFSAKLSSNNTAVDLILNSDIYTIDGYINLIKEFSNTKNMNIDSIFEPLAGENNLTSSDDGSFFFNPVQYPSKIYTDRDISIEGDEIVYSISDLEIQE